MRPSRRPCLWALFLLLYAAAATRARADFLTITTSPPGATVEINGSVAGTTPYKAEYPGGYFHKTHTAFGARLEHSISVRISKDGYLPEQITLTTGPFEWVAVTGRRRGNYFLLKSDHFAVKLEAVSHHTTGAGDSATIEGPIPPPSISAVRAASNDATAGAGTGSVVIASEPANAEIYIDGKFVGQTPSTFHLPAGSYHVAVKAQGLQDWQRDLEVLKDSELSLHAVLSQP